MAGKADRLPVCAVCGTRLPPQAPGRGRPRLYCGDRCRGRAKRARRPPSWVAYGDTLAEVPADPYSHRLETLRAVADLMDGEPPAPAADRLGKAIQEERVLAFGYRRLADELPPALAARALRHAEHLYAALRRDFPVDDAWEDR